MDVTRQITSCSTVTKTTEGLVTLVNRDAVLIFESLASADKNRNVPGAQLYIYDEQFKTMDSAEFPRKLSDTEHIQLHQKKVAYSSRYTYSSSPENTGSIQVFDYELRVLEGKDKDLTLTERVVL